MNATKGSLALLGQAEEQELALLVECLERVFDLVSLDEQSPRGLQLSSPIEQVREYPRYGGKVDQQRDQELFVREGMARDAADDSDEHFDVAQSVLDGRRPFLHRSI